MNEITEINGKKYELIEAKDTNEGKKTDCCGACVFRTHNYTAEEVDYDVAILESNPWCNCSAPCHDFPKINGKQPHFKAL